MGVVVARERELEEIRSFLELGRNGGRVLLLEGEAGVGKSTLWHAGVDEAADLGYRVLAVAAAEAETRLAYTVVRDLLADAFDEVAEELPAPQRRALAVALLREEPGPRPPQPAAAAVAFAGALRVLAGRGPTLVAVDDVQWVDPESATLLRYALRRLGAGDASALLARRAGQGELAAATERVAVEPFSVGALGRLLHDRLGIAYPRPLLQRLHAASGGNAFYALEISRVLADAGSPPSPRDPLPVPDDLLELVETRLRTLPPATLDVLALASALSRPSAATLAAAVGADPLPLLAPAVAAEVVRTHGESVSFANPLFAASIYALAAPRRRDIHARLAAVVTDPEERARHLARACAEPDETVASAVEEGARKAFSRGAPTAAVELAAEARRLTPPGAESERERRALTEADYAFAAGDTGHAASLLDELAASAAPGPGRARVLGSQARLRHFERDIEASVELLRRALAEAGDDGALRGALEEGLAWGLLLLRRDLPAAAAHGANAAALARARSDRAALAEGLAAEALTAFVLGRPWEETMTEALAYEEATLELRVLRQPGFAHGYCLSCADELDRADAVFEELLARAESAGDEGSVPSILNHLTLVRLLAGDWAGAAVTAEECLERALESGQHPTQSSILGKQALLAARRGDPDAARGSGWEALAGLGGRAYEPGHPEAAMASGGETAVWALGSLALSLGDAAEAHRLLGPLCAALLAAGVREPGEVRALPDEVEALAALGRLDEAERLTTEFSGWAAGLERPSALAAAARCAGLVAAARGDLDGAAAALDEAVAHARRAQLPFERGRALLALGSVRRRQRNRREARAALAEARDVFEALGARIHADAAVAELGRIGGRAPASGALTPSERRIAELVAEGKTNREVAALLVVAERTVESALTHIYRKLEVRSRTELARKLA